MLLLVSPYAGIKIFKEKKPLEDRRSLVQFVCRQPSAPKDHEKENKVIV